MLLLVWRAVLVTAMRTRAAGDHAVIFMRKRTVLFIQHSDVDRPGLLGETLDGMGIPMRVIRSDLGQPVPEVLEDFGGLVLGGGPQGAYEMEKYPYLSSECALVRQAASHGKPVLGLCLGAQLMASALGARVQPGQREVGFFEVTLDPISQVRSPLAGNSREICGHSLARRRLRPSAWRNAIGVVRSHPKSAIPVWPCAVWTAVPPGDDPRVVRGGGGKSVWPSRRGWHRCGLDLATRAGVPAGLARNGIHGVLALG